MVHSEIGGATWCGRYAARWPRKSKILLAYAKAKRAILYARNPAVDVHGKKLGKFGRGLSADPRFVVADSAPAWGDGRWLFDRLRPAMERWGLADTRAPMSSSDGDPCLASDTGELLWNPGDGVFTINTPCAQGAVGFVGGKTVRLADVQIAFRTPYGSFVVSSHDGRAIRESRRLLITAIARSENTGQFWENGRTVVPAEGRGRAPVLVEPVEADVSIATRLGVGKATVYPLAPSGAKRKPFAAEIRNGQIKLQFGKAHKTIHYVVELGR